MCPRQRLTRKRELRVHVNGCHAREGYLPTSTVDMQGGGDVSTSTVDP